MREILFRGKPIHKEDYTLNEKLYKSDVFKDGFAYGSLVVIKDKYYICVGIAGVLLNSLVNNATATFVEVIPETVSQYTSLKDKNGNKIFKCDIVQYLTYDGFDCQSVVKFGEYEQDGSDGEYKASDCVGFYVEVDNFTCPDWCDNEPERFHDYLKQQSLAEIASQCEIIGNIYDNPELLEVRNDNTRSN